MAFDVQGARDAGYTDAEIAAHLAKSSKFDVDGARKAGYSDAEIVSHLTTPKEKGSGSAVVDAGNAVGTGYMRGLTRLAGLPVDTVMNVVDLGKAAIGAPYIALTGKAPPDWLTIGDRKNVVGTGENLLSGIRKAGAGSLVDPVNPDYEGGYLQAAGGAMTGVMNPATRAQLANQAGLSLAGTLGGKAVGDATGNEALSIAASMAPAGAQLLATEGVKRAVRGGEAGRKQMQQRVTDLQNAGIDNPTLGLASGNQTLGGVENLLQSTPGAVGIMKRNREAAIAGMEAKAKGAADLASPIRGADVAGAAIQSDLKNLLTDRIKAGQARLYGNLDNLISADTPVNVTNTEAALNRLTSTIPGAEQTSQGFINARINRIKQGLDVDTGRVASGPSMTTTAPILGPVAESGRDMMNRPVFRGEQVGTSQGAVPVWSPQQVVTVDAMGLPRPQPSRLAGTQGTSAPVYGSVPMRTDAMGVPVMAGPVVGSVTTTVPPKRSAGAFSGLGIETPITPQVPYEAVRKLRTNVGAELADASLAPDVPTSQWKQLYAGLSEDMRGAAQQAGPQAEAALNRANQYTKAGMQRLERVQPFANATAPEQAFTGLLNSTKENNTTLQAVKKSISDPARAKVAATVIDRLGRATPGQQNELGDVFSPERFLTNWNTMTPKARNELLSGFKNADQVRADVEAVAKASSMMRENSRLWANPSGTAANASARAVLGAIGAGGAGSLAGLVDPWVPLASAGAVTSFNLIGRALTSPAVRQAMMRKTNLPPKLQNAFAASTVGSNLLAQEREDQ